MLLVKNDMKSAFNSNTSTSVNSNPKTQFAIVKSNSTNPIDSSPFSTNGSAPAIVPIPVQQQQDSALLQGSTTDILITLSISLLFITFFVLWIRAYYTELYNRKQDRMRRLQFCVEQERMRQRLRANIYEEEFWKNVQIECLPMYSEYDQGFMQREGTEELQEFEMRELDRSVTVQDVDAIECIRQPPPVYNRYS